MSVIHQAIEIFNVITWYWKYYGCKSATLNHIPHWNGHCLSLNFTWNCAHHLWTYDTTLKWSHCMSSNQIFVKMISFFVLIVRLKVNIQSVQCTFVINCSLTSGWICIGLNDKKISCQNAVIKVNVFFFKKCKCGMILKTKRYVWSQVNEFIKQLIYKQLHRYH